jgi:hypothetical protein
MSRQARLHAGAAIGGKLAAPPARRLGKRRRTGWVLRRTPCDWANIGHVSRINGPRERTVDRRLSIALSLRADVGVTAPIGGPVSSSRVVTKPNEPGATAAGCKTEQEKDWGALHAFRSVAISPPGVR